MPDDYSLDHPQGQHFTPEERLAKQQLFCDAYAKSLGNVGRACKKAGISRSIYLYWLREDHLFMALVDDASAQARDRLRDVLRERGVDGTPEPLVVNGRVVRDADGTPITVYRPDNRVLLALARAYLPEFRQEVARPDANGPNMESVLQDYILIEKRYLTVGDLEQLHELGRRIEERKRSISVDATGQE
jgi:hypothetical protein